MGSIGNQTTLAGGRNLTASVNPSLRRLKPGGITIDWDTVSRGLNETVTITVTATGGTFTITFGGQATGALAYNASAATVEDALEGLSSIGNGNVQVSLSGGVYTLEFIEDLRNTDVGAVTVATGSLTGGTATVAVSRAGASVGAATLASGQVVPDSVKYIELGTIMTRITASGKFGPADTSASDGREIVTNAVRGDCFVLDRDILYTDLDSDHTGEVFDSGTVFKSRLKIGGTNQPTEANVETMLPGITFLQD